MESIIIMAHIIWKQHLPYDSFEQNIFSFFENNNLQLQPKQGL